MSWTFEQLQTSAFGGVTQMAFDGRDVWAASGATIRVFNYWDISTEYEWLGDNYYFDRNQQPLKQYAELDNGLVVADMTYWNGHIYTLSATTIKVWNTTTKAITATLTTPEPVHSVVCAAGNKLWVTSFNPDSTEDKQSLYFYDLINNVWSSAISIPGRKQFQPRDIVDGLNGNILVTAMNDHAILRFNHSTGAYVGATRINRHPYKLFTNQSTVVYVASDAGSAPGSGMVSTYDQVTDTATNFSAAGGSLTGLFDDEVSGNLWFTGGNAKLGRLRKSDKDYRFAAGTSPGFTITLADYGVNATTITGGMVTPPIMYEKWNGTSFDTITVKPYLFFATGGNLYAARLSSMVRVNSIDVLGTAMIATGHQNYYGDIT